jgi:hypothetical protein
VDNIIYSILALSMLSGLVIFISGCTTVGKGQSSLVRIKSNDNELLRLFPQYFTINEEERLIPLTKEASTDYGKYTNFLRNRYGTSAVAPSFLGLTIRDRGKLPPFLPVDVKLPSKLYDLYTGESKASEKDRITLEKLIKARLYNVQDLIPRTTLHHNEGANEVFYYYPRLSLDFSSQLAAQNVADRFSYLGVALILEEQPHNKRGDALRFADFWPKDADIVEYTRGTLTQSAQLIAKGSVSESSEIKSGAESTQEGGKSTTSNTASSGRNAELSYTFTETYANELKDAFEQRTTGIYDDGKIFLAEFRSIKNKRIGGTYNFDLMLEMPSELDSTHKTSEPISDSITAKAYLVAVVRHVYERGTTGILTRVLEPDNDKVYEQVVVEQIDPFIIWRYNEIPYEGEQISETNQFELKVITNRDDARFVVRDLSNANQVIGSGQGKESNISLPVDDSRDIKARVEFLDVIAATADRGFVTMKPRSNIDFVIPKKQHGASQVVGEYYVGE